MNTLPIVPERWRLEVKKAAHKQFNVTKTLFGQAAEVVIATDADREGETIAREALELCRWQGPVSRLWLLALDSASIGKALDNLLSGSKTEPLYYAGLARAEWLVGMNLTRAYTVAGRSQGGDGVLSVGRVQTPTLRLVVDRDPGDRGLCAEALLRGGGGMSGANRRRRVPSANRQASHPPDLFEPCTSQHSVARIGLFLYKGRLKICADEEKLYTLLMSKTANNGFFPIRVLAERTGVGASTLRAWERRYGLLKPRRTPKGHRLYTEEEARLVFRVLELLDDGHAISEVARRILGPQVGVADSSAEHPYAGTGWAQLDGLAQGQWASYLERLLRAIEAFSPQRLDAVYNEASSLYPLDLVSRHLIEPALAVLGERWNLRTPGIAEEHFFSAWLRNKLGARLHHAAAQASGNTLLVACVPGHRHDVGVLLFALAALGRGYRVVYLGIDMPLEPLPEVVERCGAKGVILAGGREPDPEATVAALEGLVSRLSCPLFVGGPLSVRREQALIETGAVPIGEQFALALHLVASKVPVHTAQGDTRGADR